MINKRGLKLFTITALSLIILSTIITAQMEYSDISQPEESPSFEYKGERYYYNIESTNYETISGKKSVSNIPWGAKEPRGFSKFQPEKNWFDSFKEWNVTKYILGTGAYEDNKNILERIGGVFGYGNENTNRISEGLLGLIIFATIGFFIFKENKIGYAIGGGLIGGIMGIFVGGFLGLIPIIYGGIICFVLIKIMGKLLEQISGTSDIIDEILKWPIFSDKLTLPVFLGFYTLIFGAIFILLNIPIISLFKPLFWPLTTNFGVDLLNPFTISGINRNTWIGNFLLNFGIYAIRGVTFGIITFLFLIILMTLTKLHKLITTIIIHYQSEKRRMKAQERIDNLSYFAQAADVFAKAGKKT